MPDGTRQEWPLWPGDPPGTPDNPDTDLMIGQLDAEADPGTFARVGRPSLFVYPSAKPSGAGALLFPGGGYQHVAIGQGSGDIARKLNAAGVSVFMLKYRLPGGRWAAGPDMVLQDGQRAMRLIRANARRMAIDPRRVAAMGFSAGGYGAATLLTRSGEQSYAPSDDIDQQDARPDLAGLLFAVIVLDRPFAHAQSRDNLLALGAAAQTAARYSPDRHVTADAPPVFLAHAADDPVVPAQNSIAMFRALRAAHVPAQMHLFEEGGHGLNAPGAPGRAWMELFLSWSRSHSFIA